MVLHNVHTYYMEYEVYEFMNHAYIKSLPSIRNSTCLIRSLPTIDIICRWHVNLRLVTVHRTL